MRGSEQPDTGGRVRLPAALLPLALTYTAVALNMTIATVALPTISTTFHASAATLTWIVSITPMSSAALILFAGALGDRFGRKRLLLLGLTVFLVSAVLSAFAASPGQLVALRAMTGVGSAVAMPAALALVFDLAPASGRRTAVGVMSATQAVGSLLGPLLGGAALVLFWWGAAFLAVVPFLVVALVLVAIQVPADAAVPREERPPIDVVGSLLTAVVGVSWLFAAVSATSSGIAGRELVLAAVALGLVCAVTLVFWERRCPHPLFVGSIVRRRSFWVPTLAILLVQFVLGGMMFLNTQYVQLALGLGALAAGAFLLPALLMWIVASATAGMSARRLGVRNAASGALVVAAVGMLLVATSDAHPVYPVLLLGLALVGIMGLAPALMTTTAVSNYPAERRTVGSAINSVAQRFGLAFGVAALGGIMSVVYASGLAPSLTGVPSTSADQADNSLGGALQIADGLTGDTAAALAEAARDAFVSGFRVAIIVAALVLLAVALLVRLALPDTDRQGERRRPEDHRLDNVEAG